MHSRLLDLLDVTALAEDAHARFEAIARILLHARLVVQSAELRVQLDILEVEFYLYTEGSHEDPFTHGSDEQRFSGRWSFHRVPRRSKDSRRNATSRAGYRGGTRKGLDLTFGGPVRSPHFFSTVSNAPELGGGILLRSVRTVDDNPKVISGPSLLVDHILSLSNASSVSDLVENNWAGDTCAFNWNPRQGKSSLYLFFPPPLPNRLLSVLYSSPRVGLDLSHPGTTIPILHSSPLHTRLTFLAKRYRFFRNPELLKANGRAQTFLGVLHATLLDTNDGPTAKNTVTQELSRVTGMKETVVVKYLKSYDAGKARALAALSSFVGSRGKGAANSPLSYLTMMGALESVLQTRLIASPLCV